MLNKKTLSEIKKFALQTDWHIAFHGKSKGNRHLLRMLKISKFLAKKTHASSLIVEAGALLHDLALVSGDDDNYKKNKQLAIKELKRFNLTRSELYNIIECIASHEGILKPKTLEAKIVHDADVLEKSGMLGIIRHTWKLVHLKRINSSNITHATINEIVSHLKWRKNRLQTKVAKKLFQSTAPHLNKTQIKKIIQTTAMMAEKGAITEKIAVAICKHLNPKQKAIIKSQLNLSYLK